MLVWVIYDIVSDKTRRNVIKVCKNTGLYRVQKSVFLGNVEDNELDELKIRLEDMVSLEEDSVYVFPMSKKNFNRAGLIGQAFDKELVSNEIISKFF
ncbi:MAG: CRISPR-associated endonuclease Cas2 [Anaeromicrobium sp.]|jgi:CRISPR-associated protein Cas2|uniref:CRISPR-associated endonuclease Cas2 n=1 Tax=Anaeromicrobium sp. TaxID=1929132 RepID=UPI0025E44C21|nr:CRISPR-associated endonuclease Cas2 [Anaeromicrobium sp.]MCT4595719.1 CRISPR-associated endonuclease Cas2 [Anaeromicrobium sp.]